MSSQNNTEQSKRAAVLEAVSLASCDNNTTEQRLKIERLMSIVDDRVLEYVLNTYVKPYSDWKEHRKIIDHESEIDSNEFLKIVGFNSDFLYFCMYCFRIAAEGDDLDMLEDNKQRYLSNGNEKGVEGGEEINNVIYKVYSASEKSASRTAHGEDTKNSKSMFV